MSGYTDTIDLACENVSKIRAPASAKERPACPRNIFIELGSESIYKIVDDSDVKDSLPAGEKSLHSRYQDLYSEHSDERGFYTQRRQGFVCELGKATCAALTQVQTDQLHQR